MKTLKLVYRLTNAHLQCFHAYACMFCICSPANMIAQSQSGTGKTAAFVLTMLSRVVVENSWPQVRVLY